VAGHTERHIGTPRGQGRHARLEVIQPLPAFAAGSVPDDVVQAEGVRPGHMRGLLDALDVGAVDRRQGVVENRVVPPSTYSVTPPVTLRQ
jgi:hypothetical protein